jgi:GntR family carbon starvation induced transcriptional regulator
MSSFLPSARLTMKVCGRVDTVRTTVLLGAALPAEKALGVGATGGRSSSRNLVKDNFCGQYIFMTLLFETANALDDADTPRSQSSMAHQRLKGELLTGVRVPGEKLKITEIAQELGVSPGAVREALSRLVPEGLVVLRDQKGFVVAPLSMDDLDDLTRLRSDIEEIGLRRSVSVGDAEWEGTVLAAAHRLRRTVRQDPHAQDWTTQHEKFHAALVSACGSPRLLALRAQLHQQSERYRKLSARIESDRDIDAEHQSIVDAALDRDADELVRRVRGHFQHTTSLIKEGFATSISEPLDRALA